MKCGECGEAVSPGDRFCGACGKAVTIMDRPEALVASGPLCGAPADVYNAEISKRQPGCLVFLIDESGSMALRIAGSEQQKKDAVADAVNRLLYNTILRCIKEDGVQSYFDVGVIGYGIRDASGGVKSAFEPVLLSISKIATIPKRIETRRHRMSDGRGGWEEELFDFPIWFEPVAQGKTFVNAAFECALEVLVPWVGRNPNSFPPVIVNITDGGFYQKSPAETVAKIRRLATRDGHVLVFNCHISEKQHQPVVFPNDDQTSGFQKRMRQLYDLSSPLPARMCQQAQAKGYPLEPGARGYAFNADLVTLVDFLDIGTRVLQDRMEGSA
jgi:hypothetical protein